MEVANVTQTSSVVINKGAAMNKLERHVGDEKDKMSRYGRGFQILISTKDVLGNWRLPRRQTLEIFLRKSEVRKVPFV